MFLRIYVCMYVCICMCTIVMLLVCSTINWFIIYDILDWFFGRCLFFLLLALKSRQIDVSFDMFCVFVCACQNQQQNEIEIVLMILVLFVCMYGVWKCVLVFFCSFDYFELAPQFRELHKKRSCKYTIIHIRILNRIYIKETLFHKYVVTFIYTLNVFLFLLAMCHHKIKFIQKICRHSISSEFFCCFFSSFHIFDVFFFFCFITWYRNLTQEEKKQENFRFPKKKILNNFFSLNFIFFSLNFLSFLISLTTNS